MVKAEAVKAISEAEIVAGNLVSQLLNETETEQLQLFPAKGLSEIVKLEHRERVQSANPDNLVLGSEVVDEYRLYAAFQGAGFHMSNYEEIMYDYRPVEDVGKLVIGYVGGFFGGFMDTARIRPRVGRHNRMRDEISEHLFTDIAPSTSYDFSGKCYVTNQEDLKKVFEFDYDNLKVCRDLDFDLLYERNI